MATVRNITSDVLSLFRADAPPVQPGDEIKVRDENFVGRAWPKSTWELVEPPEGYDDVSTDDAYLFLVTDREATPNDPASEIPPRPSRAKRTTKED